IGVAIALAILFAPALVKPEYRAALLIAAAGVPLIALSALGAQVGRAFGWVALAYGPSQIWQPSLLVLVAALMSAAGAYMHADRMVIVSLVLLAATLAVQAAFYFRRLSPRLTPVAAQYDQSTWMRVAVPLLLVDSFIA